MQAKSPSKEEKTGRPPRTPPSRLRNGSSHRSSGSRTRSASPRKKTPKQPLHIRMNLTEHQMDKITDAFTNKVSMSPGKIQPQVRTHITYLNEPQSDEDGRPMTPFATGEHKGEKSSSPFTTMLHGHQEAQAKLNLAERRQRDPPEPLNFHEQRSTLLPVPLRPQRGADVASPLTSMPPHVDVVSPATPEAYRHQGHGRDTQLYDAQLTGKSAIRHYQDWAQNGGSTSSADQSPEKTAKKARVSDPFTNEPSSGGQTSSTLSSNSPNRASGARTTRAPPAGQYKSLIKQNYVEIKESPLFSPLPLYFRSDAVPTVKKGEKTMIGQNGWLERTDENAKTPPKKTGFFDSIKKMAKEVAEPWRQTKEQHTIGLRVSLDAREQSLLYCELEFHLTSAINTFIGNELERGHLRPDKLKKVADGWEQLGRPRVQGFRYDLETQLELISFHLAEFTFSGRRQGNPLEIQAMLHSMKQNAREMRLRTFCQPDSVIAKHLVDSRSFFNMLAVSTWQQVALGEIGQFFQLILEREVNGGKPRPITMETSGVGQGAGHLG